MKGFCMSTPCIRGLFFLFLIAVFSSSHTLQAQDNSVTIGGTEIRSDAVLYLIANGDQGLILPAVDNVNAFTPSESGMVAFNRADNRVYYYDGSAWVGVGGGSSGGGDAYSLRLQGSNLELLINGGVQDQISLVDFTVGGDLSGNIQAASVVALNGESLPGGSPTTNQILVYDGANWTYQALPSGTFTGVTVDGTTITGDGDSTPLAVGQISTAEISDISSAGSGSIITNAERNQITTNQMDIAGKQDDVLTTSGDIIYHDGTGPSRLAAGTNGQVLQLSGGFPVWQTLAASTGDITDVIAGTGLTGGGTSGSVTLNLGATGVTAGTYPKVTVNAQGRVTNGANLVAADIPNLTLAKITDAGGLAALGAVSGGAGGTITDVSITNDDISNTANINVQKLDFSGTTDGDVLQISGGVPAWSAAGGSNDAQSLQGTAIDPALATPADGEVLKWNNTNSRWEAAPDDVGGGGAPTLNDGQLIVGNGTSNSAAGVNGDLTMSGSANFQIAPDAVTTTEIGTAGISDADKVLTTDISGNPQWELKSSFVSGLDTDPSNEFNTDFRVNAGNLEVVDAGGVLAVPLTSINTDAQDLANVLGVSNDAGATAIINLANPTNPQDAATKAYVDANAGTGDMLTGTYDTDTDNIVDDAEQLGGQLPAFYLDNTDAQDLANVLGVSNDAGANAIINLADPTNPQDAATKAYVDANSGTGDMLTSTYDTDANNIVDNAEQLGGQLPSFYLDNTDAQDLANVLGVSNDAGTNAIINLSDPTNPQDAATKAYVDANAGTGDMLTSTYDTDANNIVDNAEQLGGQLPSFYLDNTDAQDLANVLGVSNDAGTNAIINLADPTNPQDAATKAYVDANGGATDLSGLSDANITTPADGQILVYDGITDNQFENVSISGDITMAANGSTAIQTGAGDNIVAAINDAGTTQSVNINRINPPGGTDKGFLTTDGTTNTWLTTASPNRVFGTDQANALTARTVALSTGAAVDNIGVRAAGTASDANLVSEAAVREAIDAAAGGTLQTAYDGGNVMQLDGINEFTVLRSDASQLLTTNEAINALEVSGSIGVGTSPLYALDVAGETNIDDVLYFADDPGVVGDLLVSQAAGGPPVWTDPATLGFATDLQSAYNGGNNISMSAATNIEIRTSAPETALFIEEATGNVGVGTNAPAGGFEVYGSGGDPALLVGATDVTIGDYLGGSFSNYLYVDSEGAGNFQFINGNVGVRSADPQTSLQVENTLHMFFDESSGQDIISHNMYEFATGDFRYTTSGASSAVLFQPERLGFFVFPTGTVDSPINPFSMRMNFDDGGLVINGDNGDASAILDVRSNTQGFLMPRMTTTERNAIVSPAPGLMVYNTTDSQVNFYNGSAWGGVGGSSLWTDAAPDIHYNGGYVGIGTNSPTLSLDVVGDNVGSGPANSGTTPAGAMRITTNGGIPALDIGVADDSFLGAWLQSHDISNQATNRDLLLNPNGGNVGVGTTTPTGALDVNSDGSLIGGLRVSATTVATYGSSIYLDGATKDWTISATNSSAGAGANKFVIRDYSSATDRFTIDTDGDVGIGTTNPTRTLQVNSNSSAFATYIQQGGPTGDGLQVYANNNSSARTVFSAVSNGGNFTVTGDGSASVSGDMETGGEFAYATPKTRYVSVASAGFTPVDNNTGRELHVGGFSSGNARWIVGGIAGSSAFMSAPLNLPHGATITELTIYVYDNDATYDISGELRRQTFGSSLATLIATTSTTSGSPGTTSIADNTISHVVDNSLYSYYITVNLREANSNLRVYGARVTYTVNEAD